MLNRSDNWWRGYAAAEHEYHTGIIPDGEQNEEWEAGYTFFWQQAETEDQATKLTPVKEDHDGFAF